MAKRLYAGQRVRADGRIEARFMVEGKRYSVCGKTAAECRKKELAKREAIARGIDSRIGNITLDAYFTEWIAAKEKSVKGQTVYIYAGWYRLYIAAAFGKLKMKAITRRAVIKWRGELAEEKGVKVTARASMLLYQIMKTAKRDGVINDVSSVEDLPPLRASGEQRPARETIHRALTEEEVRTVLFYMRQSWYYNALRFLFVTGLRCGECAALEWRDVDMKNGVLHIRRTVTRNSKGREIVGDSTKTKTSRRDIPINDNIRAIIEEQREVARAFGGNILSMEGRVFPSTIGGVWTAHTMGTAITDALKKAERDGVHIEHFSPHATRDTFASMAIKSGVPLNTLKEILGHASLAMTADLYGHVYEDQKRDAMERVKIAGI